MKKFSVNLLKIGLVLVLGLCIFGAISHVEAATTEVEIGKDLLIIQLSADEGIYGYSVTKDGKEIAHSNEGGACDYFTVKLSGKSDLVWYSTNGTHLATTLKINSTAAGKYKLKIQKAKASAAYNVDGNYFAKKGKSVEYEITIKPPTVEFKDKSVELKVGEKKDLELIVPAANKYSLDPKSSNNGIVKVVISPKSTRNKPILRVEGVSDDEAEIEVVYTVNGMEAKAKCKVIVSAQDEKKQDKTSTTTFDFKEGEYLKYTAKTKTTWNLRTKGNNLYSTKGSVIKGKIEKDDIVKVTSIPTSGKWVGVEVVTGNLKGKKGDIFFDNDAVKNFTKTVEPTESIKPDDSVDDADKVLDGVGDDSAADLPGLEGIDFGETANGIISVVEMVLGWLTEFLASINWTEVTGTVMEVGKEVAGMISGVISN